MRKKPDPLPQPLPIVIIEDCHAFNNGRDGFRITTGNYVRFTKSSAKGNGGIGFNIKPSENDQDE